MRKSIRRTTSHRKKSVYNKYNRKSRTTKKARNKLRNHKKSRKQMYVGGGCGASSAAGGVRSKEVTDWWYQSEQRNAQGFYHWIKMGPDETNTMNAQYIAWDMIHNPANARAYRGFNMEILSSDGETPSYNVHIYFPKMEMTNNTTNLTKKITSTTRCEGKPSVPPTYRVNTPPFIKPVIPSKDAFYSGPKGQIRISRGSIQVVV
jgi:hypothetical protein